MPETFEEFANQYFGEEKKEKQTLPFEKWADLQFGLRQRIPPKKTPFLKDVVSETLKGAGKDLTEALVGAKETGMALATGVPAWMGSRPLIPAKLLWDVWKTGGKDVSIERAANFANKLMEAGTYQPKTPSGQAFARSAVAPFELYMGAVDKFAKTVAPTDTEAQAAIRTGGEALLLAFPFLKGKVRLKIGKTISEGKAPIPVMKEIIAKEPKIPEPIKSAVKKLPDDLIPAEKLPAQPGLELRKIWERKGLATAEALGLKPKKKPLTREQQIKAFEEAGKVEKIPPTEPAKGGAQPISREFLYRRTVAGRPQEGPIGGPISQMIDQLSREVKPETPDIGLAIKPREIGIKPSEFKFSKPDIEARYQTAKGLPKVNAADSINHFVTTAWHKISREYEHLPHTAQWVPARAALTKLSHQRAVQFQKSAELIRGITLKQDKFAYDLFSRKVILEDLRAEAELGHHLPLGFNKNSLAVELSKLDVEVAKYPGIAKALRNRQAMWEAVKNEYETAMRDIGVDVSPRLTKTHYYRHQVLAYAQAKGIAGAGQKLQVPTWRGFLRRRKGSTLDINTDYLQAETEVLSQMLFDTEIARTLKFLEDNYDMSRQIKTQAKKASDGKNWHKYLPEGYVLYQPKEGNLFYLADTIPSKIAQKIAEQNIDIGDLNPDILRQALAMGAKRRQWVIPEKLAKTLDKVGESKSPSVISRGLYTAVRAWKIWTLLSPRRFIKYNLRNLTGDADAAFVGNTKGFRRAPQATKELWDTLVLKKPMSRTMRDWVDRGGLETTLVQQELRTLKESKLFQKLYSEKLDLNLWKRYWNAVKGATNFRESILRYANYLDYLEQITRHPEGKPKNFGASLREEIMAFRDPREKAFRLSNELLGAYDEISVGGKWLRRYAIPFWSWKELNFKRYIRLFRNAVEDGRLAQAVGGKLLSTAVKTPIVAMRVGKFAIKAYALWGLLEAWNNLKYPDIEKNLPPSIKNRPHIVFGENEKGEAVYFTRLGALGDFLEWFGNEFSPHVVADFLSGKKSLGEVAEMMAKGPPEEIIRGLSPFHKLPFELATRQALFPEAFNPSLIRDRGLYMARQVGLENEYFALTGKPSEPYKDTVPLFFAYKADPNNLAYRKILDVKRDYMKKIGKKAEGFWLTPRSNALYNLKLAHRYKDEKAKKKYLAKYVDYYIAEGRATGRPLSEIKEGIQQGLKRSLMNMHPLSGMNQYEQMQFVKSLDRDDKEALTKAIMFFNEVLLGRTQVQ